MRLTGRNDAVLRFLVFEKFGKRLEDFFLEGGFVNLCSLVKTRGKVYPLEEELFLSVIE